MSQRQGVIFDVEEQAEILNPPLQCSYNSNSSKHLNHNPSQTFIPEEETPLQQPRPPERQPRKRSLQQRWSQRLSSVIYSNVPLWKNGGGSVQNNGGMSNNSTSHFQDPPKSCKEVACVVLLPSILLSLVLIGVCSLFIYFHLLHKYHAEIDTLKAQLKAAREKDGVFLPKDMYETQIQARKKADQALNKKRLEMKSLQDKLKKFKGVIAELTAKHEKTEAQHNKTQRALDCTRTILHKHMGKSIGDQAQILSQKIDNECKLHQQAQLLLTVSDEAMKDLNGKTNRKRLTIPETAGSVESPRLSASSVLSSISKKPVNLEDLISGHVQVQTDLCSQTRNNIDSVAGRRADERSQITSTYAETVGKLIHIMGDLERLTSEHMYSEQSWVEALLKRVRNEADSATNNFHAYLVDQLLTVSTRILAALQNQDQNVQELSAKMDKNFAGLTQKLDSYLRAQTQHRQRKSQSEVDFLNGLDRRNVALASIFEDESKATDEYVKKSQAFTEQMMSLIKARAQEDEAYITARNTSVNHAITLTLATSEATTSAELDSKEFTQTLFKLETNFKDINDEIMNKMKAEKAAALEEINLAGQKAAKATARLRSDAEAFAQKAKDQWADHYSRTEASLREKSDKSSTHVTHLQGKTGVARKIIQAGQSAAESTIENWRRADEKATRASHETASAQCAVLTDFGSKIRDQIRSKAATNQQTSKTKDKRTKNENLNYNNTPI